MASSFGLLAVAGVGYCLSVPGLVSAMETRVAQAGGDTIATSVAGAVDAVLTGAASLADAAASAAGVTSASTAEAARRGSASLSGAGSLALAGTTSAAATTGSAADAATTSAATGEAVSPTSPTSPETQADPDTPTTPDGPDAAEEEAYHAYLVGKLDELDAYVIQVNSAIATFNANAVTASLSDRLVYAQQSDALTWSVLSSGGEIGVHVWPENTQWGEARGNLQGAYNRLYRYIAQYNASWDQNIQYEDPASGIDDWMEPARDPATEKALAEFNSYYARIVL